MTTATAYMPEMNESAPAAAVIVYEHLCGGTYEIFWKAENDATAQGILKSLKIRTSGKRGIRKDHASDYRNPANWSGFFYHCTITTAAAVKLRNNPQATACLMLD